MYNRYIPQPDGSYRRDRIHEQKNAPRRPSPPSQNPTGRPPHPTAATCPPPPPIPPCPPPPDPPCPPQAVPPAKRKTPEKTPSGLGGFFRQLLPKEIETADLLIILLLLLMAGDNEEDRNNALLTMALYFFM